jgi:hypothetical protein
MATETVARESLLASLSNWRLWLIQFVANPDLFALASAWLLIPESTTGYVILNFLIAFLVFVAIIALHGGTFVYFYERARGGESTLKHAFLRATRNLLPLFFFLVVFFFLRMLIGMVDEQYQYSFPTYLRSTFPVSWRNHISYQFLVTAFSAIIFVFRWIILPGLLLPFVAGAAIHGFGVFGRRGIRGWLRLVRSVSYWLILALAVLVGVFAADHLAYWTGDMSSSTYRRQLFSATIRLTGAYILALSAWMLVCSMVGRKLSAVCGAGADVAGNSGA